MLPSWHVTCLAVSLMLRCASMMKQTPFQGIYFLLEDGRSKKVCSNFPVPLKYMLQKKLAQTGQQRCHTFLTSDITFQYKLNIFFPFVCNLLMIHGLPCKKQAKFVRVLVNSAICSEDHCWLFATRCWAGIYRHWSKHWCIYLVNCKYRQKGIVSTFPEIQNHKNHMIDMQSVFQLGSCCRAKHWQCTENCHSSPT